MSGRELDNDQVQVRFDKLEAIRGRGENPYRNDFVPTHLAETLHNRFDSFEKPEHESGEDVFALAGRIMAIRLFGKAAFIRLMDRSGVIQLFCDQANLGDAGFEYVKGLDMGDFISARGGVFKTKTGELTIRCQKVELLTKGLRPLPEKFHGIADVEIKYRKRYLDLITSAETRERFRKRSKIIDAIRRYFVNNDFVEVETPMMHIIAGGANARPFKTHHNTLDMELFLRIAPELHLKRLVVGGLERVFEINRNFRNEGISIKHNPEFTMLEFYMSYATYLDLMELTEDLIQSIALQVCGSLEITYQGTPIKLDGQWKRLSVEDAIVTMSGFKDRSKIRDRAALLAYGESHKVPMKPSDSVGGLQISIFDHEVESQLIQPTFITQYPSDVSPLSRRNEKDPFLVDRFELYIYGREMANAFSELNDPVDQLERFEAQARAKKAGDEEACEVDSDYVEALEYGMPPTAGEGIGIDRLVMLLTDSPSIRDVILFPLMRPH